MGYNGIAKRAKSVSKGTNTEKRKGERGERAPRLRVGTRKREERSEGERPVIPCGKGVMILGFPRIGDSWIGERSPAALHVDAGQTANTVEARPPASDQCSTAASIS